MIPAVCGFRVLRASPAQPDPGAPPAVRGEGPGPAHAVPAAPQAPMLVNPRQNPTRHFPESSRFPLPQSGPGGADLRLSPARQPAADPAAICLRAGARGLELPRSPASGRAAELPRSFEISPGPRLHPTVQVGKLRPRV